eukprot:758566-Hanusia_phi.AAC.4
MDAAQPGPRGACRGDSDCDAHRSCGGREECSRLCGPSADDGRTLSGSDKLVLRVVMACLQLHELEQEFAEKELLREVEKQVLKALASSLILSCPDCLLSAVSPTLEQSSKLVDSASRRQ